MNGFGDHVDVCQFRGRDSKCPQVLCDPTHDFLCPNEYPADDCTENSRQGPSDFHGQLTEELRQVFQFVSEPHAFFVLRQSTRGCATSANCHEDGSDYDALFTKQHSYSITQSRVVT